MLKITWGASRSLFKISQSQQGGSWLLGYPASWWVHFAATTDTSQLSHSVSTVLVQISTATPFIEVGSTQAEDCSGRLEMAE